jgi:aspartyl-tRNA(Asn)/glutamyl-tRNA(Gln) amidotransferase subunit B
VAHPDYYEAEPNTLIDPIVIGMPGVLPVMNREAVAMSIRVGLALGCEIASFTKWDRKSYYYPDLPKNYQISQYDLPLCGAGQIETPISDAPDAERRPVRIVRAHLEEDAGKLLHEAPGGRPIDYSIVDLNRAGTPLLEIVTEPDLTSADQAVMFGQTLRNICRFLGVSEGIMQRGHMRFEPNINVIIDHDGEQHATPIVEIKNLNSFRALWGAIRYEHERQVAQWLEDGVTLTAGTKSTRGWDDAREVTVLQREKEEAHDYRYFPDPDLVPVVVSEQWLAELRSSIPELPLQREQRYVREWGLDLADARNLVSEQDVCRFFESIVEAGVEPKRAAAILRNNLAKLANERGVLASDLGLTAAQVAAIDRMQRENTVSSNAADKLYRLCSEQGPEAEPAALAERENLVQVSDTGQLDAWVDAAIEAEPQAADDIRQGNLKAIGRLVGTVMKLSKGQADPKAVQQRIREKLSG